MAPRNISSISRLNGFNEDTSAWLALIAKHKEWVLTCSGSSLRSRLADLHHEFLTRVYDPLVPSSLHQLTQKYNIPSRLWQTAFHLMLERLRLAYLAQHPAALDLLTDFVYDAYKFYTDLLEDQYLSSFRAAWIEGLGDLARYRMAIALAFGQKRLSPPASPQKANAGQKAGRIDDTPPLDDAASIGVEVADSWEVEDQETWRTTARDWYNMGITEKPGEGRLHHNLALLSRDVKGQEMRAVHHFTKRYALAVECKLTHSLSAMRPHEAARESILPLFDLSLQAQRSSPEANAIDLFIRLHGMLFTRIQLDDFPAVLERYLERIEEDASRETANSLGKTVFAAGTITQVDWMLMASINIAAMLEYGAPSGVLRRALAKEGHDRRRHNTPPDDVEEANGNSGDNHSGEGHSSPIESPPSRTRDTTNPSLERAFELTFRTLSLTLKRPLRQQGSLTVLNPYITLLLTFVATMFRQSGIGSHLVPYLRWHDLVDFGNLYCLPIEPDSRLIGGETLPEDWTVRGMDWVGRRVYERGFWKAKSGQSQSFESEMDVLNTTFAQSVDLTEGVVQDDNGFLQSRDVCEARWQRIRWVVGVILQHVDGLELESGRLIVTGPLESLLNAQEEAQREGAEREAAEAIRKEQGRLAAADDEEIEEDEDEEDDPEVAALRVSDQLGSIQRQLTWQERQRHLAGLLHSELATIPKSHKVRKTKKKASVRPRPGFTKLIFDTNVLLSSFTQFSRLVERGQWSIIIPLPVVTELDGLAKEPPPLGTTAQTAISYLETHIRSHSMTLRIQTSKGNYLSDLLIRSESFVEARQELRLGRTMDDRILDVASFQVTDASTDTPFPKPNGNAAGPPQAVLVTFDRNLRLRARARGIEAADEREMATILGR